MTEFIRVGEFIDYSPNSTKTQLALAQALKLVLKQAAAFAKLSSAIGLELIEPSEGLARLQKNSPSNLREH